jgi:hypothetical protein
LFAITTTTVGTACAADSAPHPLLGFIAANHLVAPPNPQPHPHLTHPLAPPVQQVLRPF